MPVYRAPRDEFLFITGDFLELQKHAEILGRDAVSPDFVAAFLEGAARICEDVALPLNQAGDEGCRWEDGRVATPAGFKDAYRQFAAGGWIGLQFDPAYDGKGLPGVLAEVFYEMLCSANLAFSGFIELSEAVFAAIDAHGSAEQKRLYLPKLGTGEWTGAMHLTEADAGSDLGAVRTRAEPMPDGTWRLYGSKVFITNAEHDLAENIVNVVLARTPGAPEGTRGLSLFIVPKFTVGGDGTLGPRNPVRCSSIEHKMGLRGSPTGVVTYDGARGDLLGAVHGGVRAMFTMVNDARLGVAIQGLGIAEAAYQNAVAHARERIQGRPLAGAPQRTGSVPIIAHPDVRRMLLTIRSFTQAARALGLWVALQIDLSKRHPDPLERGRAERCVALLTPVVKAHFTDCGSEAANLALQCHGGYGYIRGSGIEQLVRDVRVTQIYEGTNGIQALDLVRRKLSLAGGEAVAEFIAMVSDTVAASRGDAALALFADELDRALGDLRDATSWLRQRLPADMLEAAGGATDYLRLFGLVALGWAWTRMALIAGRRLANGPLPAGFYRDKLAVGRFFMQRELRETSLLLHRVKLGSADLMALADHDF